MTETGAEADLSTENLFVAFERDVSLDHVIEKNAQGPNGSLTPIILSTSDPFWRSVNSRSIKVEVQSVTEECTRAEVNQLEIMGFGINEDVFILNVSMHNTSLMA
jgi:hypothetical protein